MSKFLKSMIVLLAIVAMAAPAMAEDMLTMGGQMRVGGWYMDDGTDDIDSHAEQRLRIGGKFSVAEGVSLHFRTDFGEQQWGANPAYGRTAWQLDRAYLDITKGMFRLRAGQLYYGIGGQYAVDSESTGAVLDMNFGDFKTQVAYLLTDKNSDGTDNFSDDTLFVLNFVYTADNFSVNAFAANERNHTAATEFKEVSAAKARTADRDAEYQAKYDKAYAAELKANPASPSNGNTWEDAAKLAGNTAGLAAVATWDADTDNDVTEYKDSHNGYSVKGNDVYAYGVGAKFNLSALSIETGLTLFTGDFLEDVDATGTQFNLKATLALGESASVGAAAYYALAADDTERQVTYLGNGFNGYDPVNYGPLENEELFLYANRVYDFTGTGSGVVGAQIFASLNATADLTLYGSLAYLAPEDDANTTIDSDMAANVGLAYSIMDNVKLVSQAQYIDTDDAANSDAKIGFGTRLLVNF